MKKVTRKTANMHKIKFTMGDRSGDGHSITQTSFWESSAEVGKLQEYYVDNCKKLGVRFDGHDRLGYKFKHPPCSKYEEYNLPKEIYDHLKDNGVVMPEFSESEMLDNRTVYCLDCELFEQIVINIIKWQHPELVLQTIDESIPNFDRSADKYKYGSEQYLGQFGYGLFCS